MRRLLAVLSLSLLGGLAACGPSYAVVARPGVAAPPRSCRVFLEPVRTDGLIVGNRRESDWQAKKKPDARASWQKDKQDFDVAFRGELLRVAPFVSLQPSAGAYVLRPRLRSFEPGWIAMMVGRPGISHMTVELVDPSGQVVEEVSSKAVGTDFSVGGSLRLQGRILGEHFGRYAAQQLAACSG